MWHVSGFPRQRADDLKALACPLSSLSKCQPWEEGLHSPVFLTQIPVLLQVYRGGTFLYIYLIPVYVEEIESTEHDELLFHQGVVRPFGLDFKDGVSLDREIHQLILGVVFGDQTRLDEDLQVDLSDDLTAMLQKLDIAFGVSSQFQLPS